MRGGAREMSSLTHFASNLYQRDLYESSEEELLQYEEAASDIVSVEYMVDDNVKRVKLVELIVAVLMTLQWSFGAFAYSLSAKMYRVLVG